MSIKKVNLDNISYIVAKWETTCAINNLQELWCWGRNNYSQILSDQASLEDIPSTKNSQGNTIIFVHDIVQNKSGKIFTPLKNRYFDAIDYVFLSPYNACVSKDKKIFCWGDNRNQQILWTAPEYKNIKKPYHIQTPKKTLIEFLKQKILYDIAELQSKSDSIKLHITWDGQPIFIQEIQETSQMKPVVVWPTFCEPTKLSYQIPKQSAWSSIPNWQIWKCTADFWKGSSKKWSVWSQKTCSSYHCGRLDYIDETSGDIIKTQEDYCTIIAKCEWGIWIPTWFTW